MAWDGVPGDDAIYFAQNRQLDGWDAQQRVEGVGTSDRPALTMFAGRMWMAWKGIEDDSGLYFSTFDGSAWAPQERIEGRGSSHGPTLAVFGNRFYMFWKGIGDDSRVFSAWIGDQSNAIWQAQREVTYTLAQAGGNVSLNIGTSSRPAATTRGDAIVLAWKGVPGDTGIYFASLKDDEWSGQIHLDGVGTSAGPGLVSVGGRLIMAWKGIPNDTGIYFSTLG